MRLRFAVPALPLHVGGARTALLNWLLARRHRGRFVLRHDDVEGGAAGNAAADLRWLGLDWDDEVRQSERRALYDVAAERLRASGRLYPCFESEEELASKRDARQRRGEATIYDRAMLKLTAEQRAKAEAGGKRPYWRFLLSGVPAEWGDMVLGKQAVKLSAVSDPVLVRADGTPLPALCSAVDDLEMGVTHVVRGQDHLEGTGVQLELMAALGAPMHRGHGPIRFAHLPPLFDAKGARLPQRTAALTLRHLRHDGIEPAALAGMLARLGTPDAPEPALPAAMAAGFDLAAVSRSSPRFDPRMLLKMNRRALQGLEFEAVRERLPAGATPAFWQAVRGSLDLLREARGWWEVVTGTIVPPLVDDEDGVLHRAQEALPPEPWDGSTWDRWTEALRTATGRPAKAVARPLRLALTGEEQSPDLAVLLPLMGHARVAERLRLAGA